MTGLSAETAPTVNDIRHDRVTKLWLKCPACRTTHVRWPKDMAETEGLPENNLIEEVLECYFSHEWTPDSWEEADKAGLVPDWASEEETDPALAEQYTDDGDNQ